MDATPLSFELFAICVKVYKLLLEASALPRSCRYLHVRMRMERDKLVDWAVLANLSEDERTLSSGLRLNKHKVNGTLQEIRLVLLELVKLSGRCTGDTDQVNSGSDDGIHLADDASDVISPRSNSTLQQKAVAFISKTREFPKRLRWAAFDRKEFEMLLAKLTALNDGMMHFFERHRQEKHLQMQQDTFMGILQANDKLDELLDLMASLNATRTYLPVAQAHELRLLRLTRFKAFHVATEGARPGLDEKAIKAQLGDAPARPTSKRTLLDGHWVLMREDDRPGDQPGRAHGTYENTPVWVEWRYYEPVGKEESPPRYVQDRIYKLAMLLRDEEKPDEFRVPPNCLGYIHQADKHRFGFVFQAVGGCFPSSLFDTLTSSRPKPSLTTRIQMARAVATSIWYLHATNWLHRGLRSDNIMFPSALSSGPYLAGFDYSRPSTPYEATERPAEWNRHHDLYRHPSTQFDFPRDGRGGFKKLHDIYSLGVVLYEIGMWKPIHEILGINLAGCVRSADVKEAQTRLLSQGSLMSLAAEFGDAYMATVASCLSGDFGFDGFDGLDDHQANYDARLQLEFGERVIRRLDGIAV